MHLCLLQKESLFIIIIILLTKREIVTSVSVAKFLSNVFPMRVI